LGEAVMRLLWVSHSARVGGAELGLLEGIQALHARGHELHVVVPVAGPLQDRLAPYATVHVRKHKPWLTFEPRRSKRAAWLGYNVLISGPRIAGIARKIQADAIVSNSLTTMAGAVAARQARLPHLWFVHEFGHEDHGLPFALGPRLTFRLMRRWMRVCIVNSCAVQEHFRARLGIEVQIARYAIDVPDAPAEHVPGETLRLVLVGTKKPSKGQGDAIRAVAALAEQGLNVNLTLVGGSEDGYEAKLRALAATLGVSERVAFIPHAPDPFKLVCESDVVLMCSRFEALGRVTVEGMKAGKPIVGAAAGATIELVRHGWNGYLYTPGDHVDLARWLEVCYRGRHALAGMGEHGRMWAREMFNPSRYGAELEAAVQAALDREASALPR
jgi:glycosyltransferase involved in cell wall biosynthesis